MKILIYYRLRLRSVDPNSPTRVKQYIVRGRPCLGVKIVCICYFALKHSLVFMYRFLFQERKADLIRLASNMAKRTRSLANDMLIEMSELKFST